jgi:hypothetical protein
MDQRHGGGEGEEEHSHGFAIPKSTNRHANDRRHGCTAKGRKVRAVAKSQMHTLQRAQAVG